MKMNIKLRNVENKGACVVSFISWNSLEEILNQAARIKGAECIEKFKIDENGIEIVIGKLKESTKLTKPIMEE